MPTPILIAAGVGVFLVLQNSDPEASGEFQADTLVPWTQTQLAIAEPFQNQPVIDVTTYGAWPNDAVDDTAAIQLALNSMSGGGTLVFPPGEYRYSTAIGSTHDNVKLWGYGGAHLHNTRPDDAYGRHIVLRGAASGIYGFWISTDRHTRGGSGADYLVVLAGTGQEAVDNWLDWGGIHVSGASSYLVARNWVFNSTADSIRHTNGASYGRIVGNYVRGSGDDMVSVVSTRGEPMNHNITIEANDLADQYWGRGIAVVGGESVVIRNNRILGASCCAGILVAQENVYNTNGVRDVIVESNVIAHVQTTGQPKNGVRTGHSAILLNGDIPQAVRNVIIRWNTIQDTWSDGIRVQNNSCAIELIGNSMTSIGQAGINLSPAISAACYVYCEGNTRESQPTHNGRCGPRQAQ
ncbi:MAG TPA: glycosyl hydrolase family 28-related protein [Dehalococcoidia bacterium]|nr:glycosyl hydrolase family 28-related protein [Dehalococcoidia bacterium]